MRPRSDGRNILLTGATGYIVGYLLYELLRQTTANVVCLLRAPSIEAGIARLEGSLTKIGRWEPRFAGRLIPVLGDLTLPRFGLEERAFDELGASIGVIHHLGAKVDWLLPYEKLRDSNVRPLQELFELARRASPRARIEFDSTLGAMAPQVRDEISEDSPLPSASVIAKLEGDPSVAYPFIGYAKAKWAAERLCLLARRAGQRVNVYRFGNTLGALDTGLVPKRDLFWQAVRAMVIGGIVPEVDAHFSLATVDFVARAQVQLSLRGDLGDRQYHLGHIHRVHVSRLYNALREVGYELKPMPYEAWAAAAKERLPPVLRLFYPVLRRIFEVPMAQWASSLSCQIRCDRTLEALGLAASEVPTVTNERFTTCIRYLITDGYLPPPDRIPGR
jgi:thioester reductase-like protein